MEKSIEFNFKAIYHQSGEITSSINEVWFVLHGYGQLSKYFIRKFKSIANDKRLIVAPGGLSRFYLEGFNGRVGSTWMTKEERLIDIDNYVSYLKEVYNNVINELPDKSQVKFHFLGFSQGAATVVRWLQHHDDSFERLIIWAGSFPHDMDMNEVKNKLNDKKVLMVRGTEDPFINEAAKKRQLEVINELGLDVKHITFSGKHDIDSDTLEKIV